MTHQTPDVDLYENYPLVQSLLYNEATRTASLKEEGKVQIDHAKSNEGWASTIFIIRGRALDWMVVPWSIAVLHATLYTLVQELVFHDYERDSGSLENVFSFALNSTLAFLLVFRLNRAASRFWIARKYWGDIVAQSRSLVGGIIVHGDHNHFQRDGAIRWTAAFAIATMELLRDTKEIPTSIFAGILTKPQVLLLQEQAHSPMYAADQVRDYLNQLFRVDADSPPSVAIAWSQQLDTLEKQLNTLIWCGGGMERIKSTPLPIVYVSHLHTFLMINLILFPWVFGPTWGWATIPIVAISAFAWLGIECAAVEVECPFRRDRVNALNMDSFVIGLLSTLQQQLKNHADQEIERYSGHTSSTSSATSERKV